VALRVFDGALLVLREFLSVPQLDEWFYARSVMSSCLNSCTDRLRMARQPAGGILVGASGASAREVVSIVVPVLGSSGCTEPPAQRRNIGIRARGHRSQGTTSLPRRGVAKREQVCTSRWNLRDEPHDSPQQRRRE